MDIGNINKAIAVMERAKLHNAIWMKSWQTAVRGGEFIEIEIDTAARTENELHACGNKACFAGYLATSPEWLDNAGYCVASTGAPSHINGVYQHEAIALFLGISNELAHLFVFDHAIDSPYSHPFPYPHPVYGKEWTDVEADDIIRELTLLRDLGEVKYNERIYHEHAKHG